MGLYSSVNTLRGNVFTHSADAGHSETLADTIRQCSSGQLWALRLQSSMTANDQHQPANSRATAALATTRCFLRASKLAQRWCRR